MSILLDLDRCIWVQCWPMSIRIVLNLKPWADAGPADEIRPQPGSVDARSEVEQQAEIL